MVGAWTGCAGVGAEGPSSLWSQGHRSGGEAVNRDRDRVDLRPLTAGMGGDGGPGEVEEVDLGAGTGDRGADRGRRRSGRPQGLSRRCLGSLTLPVEHRGGAFQAIGGPCDWAEVA